jgi:trigger factor
MNVEVETLPNCLATMRVEVEPEKVNSAWDKVTRDFSRAARIPGYRPGRAPQRIIEAKFKRQIQEEVEKTLLSQSCREAISEKNLRVLSLAEIQDVTLERNHPLSFTATLVMSPEFELPDYTNIKVEPKSTDVTDVELDDAINNLRDQRADFVDVEGRGVQMEDFAVIDYIGSVDGRPLVEVFPKVAKALSENRDFWLKMTGDAFLPGFADQLVGGVVGESREFDVKVPDEFPIEGLGGKEIHYDVTVKGIKEKILPELNDEFASGVVEGKSLEDLRELAHSEIARQKVSEAARDKRNQIMKALLSQVECELPEDMVVHETRRVLNDLVKENQSRGISEEQLKEKEQDLVAAAGKAARERLKGTFILLRIAEKEEIRVSREDYERRVMMMAMRYQTSPEKLKSQIRENNAEESIREEILTGKVLDFLAPDDSVTGNPEQKDQA